MNQKPKLWYTSSTGYWTCGYHVGHPQNYATKHGPCEAIARWYYWNGEAPRC